MQHQFGDSIGFLLRVVAFLVDIEHSVPIVGFTLFNGRHAQSLGMGRISRDICHECFRETPISKDLRQCRSHTAGDRLLGAVLRAEIVEGSILIPHSVTQQRSYDGSCGLGLRSALSLGCRLHG